MNGIHPTHTLRVAVLGGFFMVLAAGCAATRPEAEDEAAHHDPNVVEADDVRGRSIARVQEMLRGQIAGVEVIDTPHGLAVRIRGASSVYASTDPLFIIDGFPLQFGSEGVLVGINPQDIESIRVLKNASDTAAYGMRGANGVVLITTKRPPPPDDSENEI